MTEGSEEIAHQEVRHQGSGEATPLPQNEDRMRRNQRKRMGQSASIHRESAEDVRNGSCEASCYSHQHQHKVEGN